LKEHNRTDHGGETGQDDNEYGVRISPVSCPVLLQISREDFPKLFEFFRGIITRRLETGIWLAFHCADESILKLTSCAANEKTEPCPFRDVNRDSGTAGASV
jgi:hypothetical protein